MLHDAMGTAPPTPLEVVVDDALVLALVDDALVDDVTLLDVVAPVDVVALVDVVVGAPPTPLVFVSTPPPQAHPAVAANAPTNQRAYRIPLPPPDTSTHGSKAGCDVNVDAYPLDFAGEFSLRRAERGCIDSPRRSGT
jgi:hypothetical protein